MNVLLTDDGQHYLHSDIHNGHALVIDIGGFTTDWIEVNPGGEVDYSIAKSVPVTQYHFLWFSFIVNDSLFSIG